MPRSTETVQLCFNVDAPKLQRLGIDPTTSEGQLRLRDLFLDGLKAKLDTLDPRSPNFPEEHAAIRLFLCSD